MNKGKKAFFCLAALFVFLGQAVFAFGCGNPSGKSLGQGEENAQKEGYVQGRQEELAGRDTDISASLSWQGSMELAYARKFAVDYYEDGYVLLSVADGRRYLVVPVGGEPPDDLQEEIIVLQQPLTNIYLVASAVMDIFRELDVMDSIRFSGQKAEGWYIDEAKAAMEQGKILYAGKYNAPDYELIVSNGCSLAIENNMINHSPEVVEKLQDFGIPVLIDLSSYEEHPLGRVEWIRLYGVLLGREDAAGAAFRAQTKMVEQVTEKEISKKSVAFFYITANGMVNVRIKNDYVPKMIALAGGTYVFDDLGEEGSVRSSMSMQMEEFYQRAKDADYLIYNSTIDGELDSIEELLQKEALLADFKAVKENHVWCTTRELYQQSMSIGQMIQDIHSMLSDHAGDRKEMKYLYPLE